MEKNFRQTILVALELNLEKKEKEKSDRPSIDLVCVVDTSGSMDGKKI
jgi:Mg-chelatase subunit ChlD